MRAFAGIAGAAPDPHEGSKARKRRKLREAAEGVKEDTASKQATAKVQWASPSAHRQAFRCAANCAILCMHACVCVCVCQFAGLTLHVCTCVAADVLAHQQSMWLQL